MNLPPRSLRALTAHVVAYRFQLENERIANMDRLSEKVSRASGVVGRLTKKFEIKLDELIAREGPVDQRLERTFAMANGHVDDHLRGLDQLEGQLALISNAPLDGSAPSSSASAVPQNVLAGVGDMNSPKAAPEPFVSVRGPPGYNESV